MDFIIRKRFPQPNTLLIFTNARPILYNGQEIKGRELPFMPFKIVRESFFRMYAALPSLPAWRINFLYILVGLVLVSILLTIVLAVKKKTRFITGVLSILSAALIILICIFYPYVSMLYAHPGGNPGEEAGAFLNALSEGRINDAYGVLYGSASETGIQAQASGLYTEPTATLYFDYLKSGYSYEYLGDMSVTDLSASVPVRIYYSDLNKATARVDELFDTELDGIIQSHAIREVYKDDDSYQEWVVEEAYKNASEAVLTGASEKACADLLITLEFKNGKWNILPTDELLTVLGGGVCANPTSAEILSDKVALYANNTKSTILADLVYIPKLYSIPEDALCGYIPADDKFHELTDPFMIAEATAGSERLIGDQQLVFDPNVTFAPGQHIYYYADESMFAIVWKEFCNNCYCNFAEVFIADPSQLRRKIAGDTYGYGVQMYASQLASQANAVVAMNGDFYKFRSIGLTVYDRTVCRCEGTYLDTCFFDTQGNMIFSYAGELTTKEEAQQFVDDNDILFSVSFGPVLIDNGVPKENLNYRIGETMQSYSRSAIGQVGEGHYLMMTIGHVYPYRECCPLKGAQDIMLLKHCYNAYTLDGGQTAEIIWRDRPYSYVDWGVERTVSDIIYFATAVPEDEQ